MYDSDSHSCFKDMFVSAITRFANLLFFRGKTEDIIIVIINVFDRFC